MDEILKLVAIVALLAISFFAVFGVMFFIKTQKVLQDSLRNFDKITENTNVLKTRVMISLEELSETNKELKEVKQKSIYTMEQWNETSKKTNDLIDNVNQGTKRIISTIEPYERLVDRSYQKIAPPIDKATSVISALSKAVSVFSSKLSSK